MIGVLRDFRRAADALERVAATIGAAGKQQADTSGMMERLNELERERTMWEADVEAMLQKAEGKLKAAANSEARERTMKKSYENLDVFDEGGEESQQVERPPVFARDVEAGTPAELYPVRMDLAANDKENALRAKFL